MLYRLLLLFILSAPFHSKAQVYVYADQDSDKSSEVVKISPKINFPDIRVQLGRDIPFEDIRVSFTSYRTQANYILTDDESDANQSVLIDNCNNFPDLSIEISTKPSFPDYRIEFTDNESFADVLIYSEKIGISQQDIVACLLPLIRKKTGK